MWRTVSGISVGRPRPKIYKAPTIVAPAGASAGGAGAPTYDLTASGITDARDNDIIFFLIETANEVPPLTPSGYTYLTPYGTGVAAAVDAVALHAAWYRVSGTPVNPSFGDAGDHIFMRALLIRGCRTTGAPVVILNGAADSTSEGNIFGTPATTIDNTLVLHALAHGQDSAAGFVNAFTSQSLSNASQPFTGNGTTLGNGGGLASLSGTMRRKGTLVAPNIDMQTITQPQAFARVTYAFLPN